MGKFLNENLKPTIPDDVFTEESVANFTSCIAIG